MNLPMKRTSTLILLLLALSVIVITSCQKKPIACLNYETTLILDSVKVGIPVHFTSCSDNADRLEWNLGDGTKNTYPIVDHPYDTPGQYTVTLSVWNHNNKYSDETSTTIIVYP